jgi:hypothetical protein
MCRGYSLKSPTSRPDSGSRRSSPLHHSMATSLRGGAGRGDELRRTRLYREAFMYRRVHSFLVGATRPSWFLGIALAIALFATPTAAIEFVGKVVGVTDGDTITVLTAQQQQHRVRLSGIDAPEKRQSFGERSKQSLSNLVYGKRVKVEAGPGGFG